MYIPRLDGKDKEAIKHGDVKLLIDALEKANKTIVEKLKIDPNDVRFHQGASHIVDTLLSILK